MIFFLFVIFERHRQHAKGRWWENASTEEASCIDNRVRSVAVQTDMGRAVGGRKALWNSDFSDAATGLRHEQETLQSSSLALSAETEPAFLGSGLDADERRRVSFKSGSTLKSISTMPPNSKNRSDRLRTSTHVIRDRASKQALISRGRSQKVAVPSNTSSINSLFSSRASRDDLSVTAASISAKLNSSNRSAQNGREILTDEARASSATVDAIDAGVTVAKNLRSQPTPSELPRGLSARKGRAYHNYNLDEKTVNRKESPAQHQIDLSQLNEAENNLLIHDSNGNLSARSRLSLSSK